MWRGPGSSCNSARSGQGGQVSAGVRLAQRLVRQPCGTWPPQEQCLPPPFQPSTGAKPADTHVQVPASDMAMGRATHTHSSVFVSDSKPDFPSGANQVFAERPLALPCREKQEHSWAPWSLFQMSSCPHRTWAWELLWFSSISQMPPQRTTGVWWLVVDRGALGVPPSN